MKKVLAVGMLAVLLVGCSMTATQKSQFVTDAKNVLNAASLAEGGLYTVFLGLCAASVIPAPACIIGGTADGVFKVALQAAMTALDNFAAGNIDQATAQASVNAALVQGIQASNTISESIGTGTKALMQRQGIKPLPPVLPPKK